LDRDQRNTLHFGGQHTLPWRSYASTDVYYASGSTNGDPTVPGDHLQPHTTFDLSLGKSFGFHTIRHTAGSLTPFHVSVLIRVGWRPPLN